jgi:hypothetical protein
VLRWLRLSQEVGRPGDPDAMLVSRSRVCLRTNMDSSQLWDPITTGAVGVLAAWIATLQYLNTRFSPRVTAVVGPIGTDGKPLRFVVTIRNKGGATGMVARVAVVASQTHRYELKASYPGWTDAQPPFPFLLGGHAAAIVVMDLDLNDLGDPKGQIPRAARVLVSYDGKRQNCTKYETTDSILLDNRTALPPDSLAIMKPPN